VEVPHLRTGFSNGGTYTKKFNLAHTEERRKKEQERRKKKEERRKKKEER
jgi:hypothetical protein